MTEDPFADSIVAAMPRLIRYARRISKEPQDLAQATMLRALEKRDLYRDLGQPIDGWLIRIASNIRYDWNKKEMRCPTGVEEYEDMTSRESGADTKVFVKEVLAGLSRLPSNDIALMYADGVGQKETANFLGIPSGTVASRLNRVQRLMREKFS